MPHLADYLPRRSFNTYGLVLLTLFMLFAVAVIGLSSYLTVDTPLHCYDETIKRLAFLKFINAKCSLEYQEKFYFILPMYGVFALNYGIVFALSIIYAYLVKHRVEKFIHPTGTATCRKDDEEYQATCNNDDDENQATCGHDDDENQATCSNDDEEHQATCSDDDDENQAACSDDDQEYQATCSDDDEEHQATCSDDFKEHQASCSDDFKEHQASCSDDFKEHQASCSDDDDPVQNSRDDRKCLDHYLIFPIYVIHLFVARIIPLLVFVFFLYRANFPIDFVCSWQPEMQGKGTTAFNVTENLQYNLTSVRCVALNGEKHNNLISVVATMDILFVTFTVMELGHIGWLAFNDRDFMTDEEFCSVYLLRKRKLIRKLATKLRNRRDPQVFQLIDDFGGPFISSRGLEDIYVNVVIQEGREHMNAYPRTFDRHKIYESHLEMPSTVIKLTNTADIFKPTHGEKTQTYPRTILVIGRPGVGKTMLTRMILHQWKERKHDKIVILIKFHTFNNRPVVTFREMLAFSEGMSTCATFESVYNAILSNPSKAVLIFDGLDELCVDSKILHLRIRPVNCLKEKMSVFAIFKMLVEGRLLPGVTVLATSRPTAACVFQTLNFERTVEILGFFEDQIKEYVFKFCENNNDTAELIWNQIVESPELLSLCYSPVMSYVICLTLKEMQYYENGHIPKTITELYKRAVNVLLYRHHPRCKLQTLPIDYLNIPFPRELKNDLLKLKEVAQRGIIEGKFIFEQTTTDEFGDLANCGLFHKLPDKRRNYFCFLHLTLQEFLAASKVVDNMDKVDQFLATHINDPKWHLVIQFVAGLVGDKIREASMSVTSDPNEFIMSERNLADIQKRYYIFSV